MGASWSQSEAWQQIATKDEVKGALNGFEVWQKAQEDLQASGSVQRSAPSSGSLLERVGGPDVVRKVVERFCLKLYVNEGLAVFLQNTDIVSLRAKQSSFMMWLLSPSDQSYINKHLRTAHLRLIKQHGFCPEDFELGLSHFEAAMRELGVAEALVKEVMDKVRPFKDVTFTPLARDADEERRWAVEERLKRLAAAGTAGPRDQAAAASGAPPPDPDLALLTSSALDLALVLPQQQQPQPPSSAAFSGATSPSGAFSATASTTTSTQRRFEAEGQLHGWEQAWEQEAEEARQRQGQGQLRGAREPSVVISGPHDPQHKAQQGSQQQQQQQHNDRHLHFGPPGPIDGSTAAAPTFTAATGAATVPAATAVGRLPPKKTPPGGLHGSGDSAVTGPATGPRSAGARPTAATAAAAAASGGRLPACPFTGARLARPPGSATDLPAGISSAPAPPAPGAATSPPMHALTRQPHYHSPPGGVSGSHTPLGSVRIRPLTLPVLPAMAPPPQPPAAASAPLGSARSSHPTSGITTPQSGSIIGLYGSHTRLSASSSFSGDVVAPFAACGSAGSSAAAAAAAATAAQPSLDPSLPPVPSLLTHNPASLSQHHTHAPSPLSAADATQPPAARGGGGTGGDAAPAAGISAPGPVWAWPAVGSQGPAGPWGAGAMADEGAGAGVRLRARSATGPGIAT